MGIIFYAIPGFFLLIAIELVVDRVRGTGYFRVNDSLTSLSTGVINQVVKTIKRLVPLTLYYVVYENYSIFDIGQQWWVWIVAFILWDLVYYWEHRLGHEVNILWASHVVHHSSEDYNLTTALRQTGTGFLNVVFALPLALLGFDVVVIATVASINLIYQFWVHTRHVGKLGWIDYVFVTPSNHRAHHAQNSVYIDRNYGGVFILWDRLFGTFQEELDEEPVIFGITGAVKSLNPIYVNLQVYKQLVLDAWRAESWWDKLTIWFRRTGWRPADVEEKYPLAKVDLSKFEKYDPPAHWMLKVHALLQYAMTTAVALFLSSSSNLMSMQAQFAIAIWVLFSLFSTSAVLESRRFAMVSEAIRLGLLAVVLLSPGLLFGAASEFTFPALLSSGLLIGIGLSVALLLFAPRYCPEAQVEDPTPDENQSLPAK